MDERNPLDGYHPCAQMDVYRDGEENPIWDKVYIVHNHSTHFLVFMVSTFFEDGQNTRLIASIPYGDTHPQMVQAWRSAMLCAMTAATT